MAAPRLDAAAGASSRWDPATLVLALRAGADEVEILAALGAPRAPAHTLDE